MPDLLALGDVHFIQLTTFRKSGEGVGTTVWVARDGATLVVYTPAGSGKLKRLKHTSRVEVVECGRQGKVADDAHSMTAEATVETDRETVDHVAGLMRSKYGAEYRIFMAVESVVARLRRRRKPGRAVIRISATTTAR